ncbi:MAG: protein kinase, partial [Candidatus Eisenbacteria bacterium]|nr:protein kinase [Candidatus Eisenbacteria bacterium]
RDLDPEHHDETRPVSDAPAAGDSSDRSARNGSSAEDGSSHPRDDTTLLTNPSELVLETGVVFADRYEIRAKLGEGGFGTVYHAFDRGPLQRDVALKTIKSSAFGSPGEQAEARAQFLYEASLAGRLSSEQIATIFDVGERDGTIYMTQELVAGQDLRVVLGADRALPLRRVLAIMGQVCTGLAYAHAQGVIHRDIKPGNILVDAEDRVKITDFGLAQLTGGRESETRYPLAGTPGYMAPEQLLGEPIDARADVFASGCVLYELLTGRAPFAGDTQRSIIEKTCHHQPPSPSRVRADLPRSLDRVVSRALRKNADERYAGMRQMQQDLVNYEQFEWFTSSEDGAQVIADALGRREGIVFLGDRLPVSGQGAVAGALTSDRVIAAALAERISVPPDSARLPELAQALETERGREDLLRALAGVCRNEAVSPREVIRRLARLPVSLIVTTRYDTFLRDELARGDREVRCLASATSVPNDLANAELLLHLFGHVEENESLIVTEDDLWSFFSVVGAMPEALRSRLATWPLLFIGYDPDDQDFRRLLLELSRFRDLARIPTYLAGRDFGIPAVAWAERHHLHLIDDDAAPLLTQIEERCVARERETLKEPETATARLPSRPYKFLNYYDAEDEAIFFGRAAETRQLVSRILSYRLNLLYAPSGVGKTSLLRAGLMPALEKKGYRPAYCRVFDDPPAEIRHALERALRRAEDGAGGSRAEAGSQPGPAARDATAEALDAFAGRLAAHTANLREAVVLIIDQLEELFLRFDAQTRTAVARLIRACVEHAGGRIRVLLSLREDFLARLSDFREQLPTVFHNGFCLQPPGAREPRGVGRKEGEGTFGVVPVLREMEADPPHLVPHGRLRLQPREEPGRLGVGEGARDALHPSVRRRGVALLRSEEKMARGCQGQVVIHPVSARLRWRERRGAAARAVAPAMPRHGRWCSVPTSAMTVRSESPTRCGRGDDRHRHTDVACRPAGSVVPHAHVRILPGSVTKNSSSSMPPGPTTSALDLACSLRKTCNPGAALWRPLLTSMTQRCLPERMT